MIQLIIDYIEDNWDLFVEFCEHNEKDADEVFDFLDFVKEHIRNPYLGK